MAQEATGCRVNTVDVDAFLPLYRALVREGHSMLNAIGITMQVAVIFA